MDGTRRQERAPGSAPAHSRLGRHAKTPPGACHHAWRPPI